jgi:ABC-type transport system involved in multi-copper enzyme maturation permease subunit
VDASIFLCLQYLLLYSFSFGGLAALASSYFRNNVNIMNNTDGWTP